MPDRESQVANQGDRYYDGCPQASWVHSLHWNYRKETLGAQAKLSGDFKRLAGSTYGHTKNSLFGNIVENVKQISDTAKFSSLMENLGVPERQQKVHPLQHPGQLDSLHPGRDLSEEGDFEA